jgi:23S rRNA (cytosine1962-C5)-methyltransferase
MLTVTVKKGREKPVVNGHPWIFSGSIHKVDGEALPGASCIVKDPGGVVLGHGYYNATSSITVRMLTKGDEPFTDERLRRRIERAIAARRDLLRTPDTDSCRLVNAEGDFLPGLVVDSYAGGLCVQLLTAGMERLRPAVLSALGNLLSPRFIFERSDTEARKREGLLPGEGLLQGDLSGPLVVRENGLRFGVDLAGGQKTGFFFDQRVNRMLVRAYAKGARCLDCFSYSGAFALNMATAGAASVTSVDLSKNAGEWQKKNRSLNGFDLQKNEFICADVFNYLRKTDGRFDLVVLDPPKFAPHPSDVPKAARGYKDINLIALRKIEPGGTLFTFSCSNAVDTKLFRQIVFAAAADAKREVQLIHQLSAGPDHPVNIAHPEGEYLKGLALRVY